MPFFALMFLMLCACSQKELKKTSDTLHKVNDVLTTATSIIDDNIEKSSDYSYKSNPDYSSSDYNYKSDLDYSSSDYSYKSDLDYSSSDYNSNTYSNDMDYSSSNYE